MRKVLTLGLLILGCSTPPSVLAQTSGDLFDDSALQEIRLEMNAADWRALRDNYQENTYYPADLHWRGEVVRNVGVRSRGSGSRNTYKPGLKIDMNRYVSGQKLLGLKSVVLDNAFQDPTLIKERVAMQVFRRVGVPVPREAHARLTVNGVYSGVYVIVESIDKDFLARVYGEHDGNVENDGYLFEFEYPGPWDFRYLGPALETYQPIFKPQTRENDAPVQIWGPIEEWVRVVNEVADADFTSAVGRFLDLESYVKVLAVENFLAEYDGLLGYWGMNNFYLYRFEDSTRSQFLPWDKDYTFQNTDHAVDYHIGENILARRTLADPLLRQLYWETLMQCAAMANEPAEGDARGWLEREVSRVFDQIREAALEDTDKRTQNDAMLEEVDYLKSFAQQRGTFVACSVANAVDPLGDQRDCAIK